VETVSKTSNVFLELGFDLHFLGNEHNVKTKLENLTCLQLRKGEVAFIKKSHLCITVSQLSFRGLIFGLLSFSYKIWLFFWGKYSLYEYVKYILKR
jgi:hypothetical protein